MNVKSSFGNYKFRSIPESSCESIKEVSNKVKNNSSQNQSSYDSSEKKNFREGGSFSNSYQFGQIIANK